MIHFLKRLIFAYDFKHKVNKAKELNTLTGLKYYVIRLNGKLHVVPKQTLKELIQRRRFKKGTTIQDIEHMALFVTL